MLTETKNKPSLFDFVRYLREHIYQLADNQNPIHTDEEKLRLRLLSNTVEILESFTEEVGDTGLYDILTDLTYAVNESLMGAPFKGKDELDSCAFKLADYETQLTEARAE